MRHLKYIVFIFLLYPRVNFGQDKNNYSTKQNSKYSKVKYEIINIDTVVTHYVNGKYNTPDFKMWDSTKIWAHIILTGLPEKINYSGLKNKVEDIMKKKGINKASIFRDTLSSSLFRFSSVYAAKKLKERDGYLGQFNLN